MAKVIKLFTAGVYEFFNKLEGLSLASFSSLVQCLSFKARANMSKAHLGPPLYGKLVALPTNIRQSGKGLPGTNTLAYYEHS
jgi:hypothetical protein